MRKFRTGSSSKKDDKKKKGPVITIDDDDDDWVKIEESNDEKEKDITSKIGDDWVQVSSSKEEDITKADHPTTIIPKGATELEAVDIMKDLLSASTYSADQASIGSKLAHKFQADTSDDPLPSPPSSAALSAGYSTPYYKAACAYDDPSWEGVELPQTSTECRRKFKYLIRRGVPDRCRRSVWLAASGAAEVGRPPESLYEVPWRQTFGTSLSTPGKVSDGENGEKVNSANGTADKMPVIGNVPTFGGSFVYSSQYITDAGAEAAKRLLCVIATAHPEIEFSPFIPAIVVILLGFMKEAEAFAVIEAMLNSSKMAGKDDSSESKKHKQYVFLNRAEFIAFTKSFDTFMKKKYSKIIKKMDAIGVNLETVARSLFESFFSGFVSYPLILRIFDAFINEGVRVIFRVAASLITSFKFAYLPISTNDEFREYFTQYSLQRNARILKQAFSITISQSKIRKLNKTHLLSSDLAGSDAMQDAGRIYYRPKMSTTSEIISDIELETIWSFLPRRYIITDPVLLFTTAKNGFNLRTMIESTKDAFPILCVIRAREYSFGFYCSDSLYGAEQDKPIGTGECFIFSIKPEMKVFQWTKKNNSYFMLSDRNHLLTAGAGGAGAGIVLTEDLNAQSWSCATFENTPLIGKIGTEKEIPCAVVELYTLE